MTPAPLRQRTATLALIIATMLVLAGCAPGAQLTSPVGVWEATGEDNGTLTIKDDGTFTVTDASFNPIQRRDADDNFNGTGTWLLIREDSEVALEFDQASQGDFYVEPAGPTADFRSGVIRFRDPDELATIEFRFKVPESSS